MNAVYRFVALALCLLVAGPALGQRRSLADLRKAVDALETEVAKVAAATPTLSDSVTDLTSRLARLEQALEKVERQRQAMPDAVNAIDELQRDVGELKADLEELRTRLGDVEQPAEAMGGGGGVTYNDGFVWKSGGSEWLRLGGFMQFRSVTEFAEDSAGDFQETAGVEFRRTRFYAEGSANWANFRLLMDPRLDGSLLDYQVQFHYRYRGIPITFTFGQGRSVFTRNFMTWAPDTLFVDRPTAVEDLRYDRSPGVGVEASFFDDKLWLYLGGTNGSGRNSVNDNVDGAGFVRVEGAVLGKRPKRYSYGDIEHTESPVLVLGAGFVHDLSAVPDAIGGVEVGERDVDSDGDVDNVRVLSGSADLLFRYRGFEVITEAIVRSEDWGTVFDHPENTDVGALFEFDGTRNYLGFYGDFSYAWNNVLFGGRLGHHRQTAFQVDGRAGKVPKSKRLFEGAAVVQSFYGKRRTFGVEYRYRNHNNGDVTEVLNDEEHRVVFEAQLGW